MTALVTSVILLATLLPQTAQRAKPKPPLTSKQIVDLIGLGAPDNVIAAEIEARGLNFVPSFQFLDELPAKRVGRLTMNALAARTPHPAILVKCQPGAQVEMQLGWMDHTERVVVDAKGEVLFPGLRPGTVKLRVTKDKYSPVERIVSLTAAETVTETILLSPLTGHLALTVDPPEAVAEIRGETYPSGPLAIELPAGKVLVVVRHDGFIPQEKEITVMAGETTKAEFLLRVDPSATGLLARRADELLQRGEAQRALALVEKVLAVAPAQAEPLEVGARALAALGREDDSSRMFSRAIRSGARITFVLNHHHFDFLHPVQMTISKEGIRFDDQGERRCGIDRESLPLEVGRLAQTVVSRDGEAFLRLQGVRPDNPKRKLTLNFAGVGCQLVKEVRATAGGLLQVPVSVVRCSVDPLPHLKHVTAVLQSVSIGH